ncbi:3D domain-containing protein [Catenulispora yoronensis]|uniref:3D domain-containing protein n=1 Tax=Catenulispora yoronensis TaxID=450799 RepID=UPI0031DA788A
MSSRFKAGVVAACAAALGVAALVAAPLIPTASAAGATGPAANLPSCGFWAPDVTAPARSVTPWTKPLQTAGAVNFSTRQAAPTITSTMANGQVTITVAPVANAVAYKVWRDGVTIGYISYWGQTTPLTVTDTTPCASSYYDVIAMYDTNNNDASYGQLSVPYWLNNDGSISPGTGSVAPGTTLSNFMVTSYDNLGPTATGFNAQIGVCATDPRYIPWGTYFTVPDYGTCMAGDLGTWIQGNIVDIWLPSGQASDWGVQKRNLTVIANPYGGTPQPPTSSGPTTSSSGGNTSTSPGGPSSSSPTKTTPSSSTPSSTPSSKPSSTASSTSSPSPSASGTCATAWNASTSYNNGQVVSYSGHNYTATWYSAGAVPNASTSWAVWKDSGACH